MRSFPILPAIAIISLSCGGEPSQQQTEAVSDSTAIAAAAYDPTMFDTVTWESQEEALERGQVVYRFSCLKCHGESGLGDSKFVRGGDTLRPPSFREPNWAYADDKESLREQVFIGTAEAMPHWGLVGLKARDVDAVAIFIMEGMRKD